MFWKFWGFKKSKHRRRTTELSVYNYKEEWKVFCKDCKHFHRKMNDWYYLNNEPFPVPNSIPVSSRSSEMKWISQCLHPDNHKTIITYRETYAEREEIKTKNTRRPSCLNMNNDCTMYEKKHEEKEAEPLWTLK